MDRSVDRAIEIREKRRRVLLSCPAWLALLSVSFQPLTDLECGVHVELAFEK